MQTTRSGSISQMIHYTHAQTPFGPMVLALKDDKIAGLAFGGESQSEVILSDLFGEQEFIRDDHKLAPFVTKVVEGKIIENDLYLEGTPFQLSVWRELMKIPEGKSLHYSDIARAIGKSKAVRAVGTAVGQNKISVLVPCHRVLPKSGGVGNYRWGSAIKESLLKMEKAA